MSHRLGARRSLLLSGALGAATLLGGLGLVHPATAASAADDAPAKRYVATGSIKSIAEDRRSLLITHDDIPGFMRAMTMRFGVRSPEQLRGLSAGQRVRFEFEARGGALTILVISAL